VQQLVDNRVQKLVPCWISTNFFKLLFLFANLFVFLENI
jgi:hypothetical protein